MNIVNIGDLFLSDLGHVKSDGKYTTSNEFHTLKPVFDVKKKQRIVNLMSIHESYIVSFATLCFATLLNIVTLVTARTADSCPNENANAESLICT